MEKNSLPNGLGEKDNSLSEELFIIKPLEWEEHKIGYWAKCFGISAYYIYRPWKGPLKTLEERGWEVWAALTDHRVGPNITTIEEGKALAEAHWREYIKQGLVLMKD